MRLLRRHLLYIFSRVHATLQVTLSVCRSVGLSVGRSVGLLVGLSHSAFFVFLGYLQVGKRIFEYLVSYKQHSRQY